MDNGRKKKYQNSGLHRNHNSSSKQNRIGEKEYRKSIREEIKRSSSSEINVDSALVENTAQVLAGANVDEIVKSKTQGKSRPKKDKTARPYTEIIADLSDLKEKNTNPVDRCISLLLEIRLIKELLPEQIHNFFVTAEGLLEDAWVPFLTKASLNIDPNKIGNDFLIVAEIVECCQSILKACSLDPEEITRASQSFCETKDAEFIVRYLNDTEQHKSISDNNKSLVATREITSQELACIAYICFTLDSRSYAPASYDLLVKIDRAIAEHFSRIVMKEQAGKTVGNVLSARLFSPKKIAELTYLYGGTTDTIKQQSERIVELKEDMAAIKARNAELESDLKYWKGVHADLVEKNRQLEKELDRLSKDRTAAEDMLEYERNKFKRQMETKEAGLAEQLSDNLSLEIQAIRETVEYVDEDNQRRILRRLQRIDKILHEFGGVDNA